MTLTSPITPRQPGRPLRVVIPGRISRETQDSESIPSQHQDAERWLRSVYDGPVDIVRLGEQASGWLANRDSMEVIQKMIENGEVDLVLATELREIYRNPAFHWKFAQDCVDNDVRLILIADGVDTADENWETMMHTASMRYGLEVPAARRRVRRKATYSFSRGGMVLKIKFGYRKLSREEADSGKFGSVGLRIAKVSDWTSTIREMRDRVLKDESYAQIADWLNELGIPAGPYVKDGKWTGRVVRDLLRDPILSGQRRFRTTITKMVYKTGKSIRNANPEAPQTVEYPELAHVTIEEHLELIAAMDARKARYKACQKRGKESPLWRRPRSRSLWPGQHARCSACGAFMYRSGEMLKCAKTLCSQGRTCWNHVHVRYDIARQKVLAWLLTVVSGLPKMREHLIDAARQEFERQMHRSRRTEKSVSDRIAQFKKEVENVKKAIRLGGPLESLVIELAKLERYLNDAHKELETIEANKKAEDEFPSPEVVLDRLPELLDQLTRSSLEFADLLRRLLPVFVIQPVRALDSGAVYPRAKLTLRFDDWCSPGEQLPEVSTVLDMFDPPEPVKHMQECVQEKQKDAKTPLRKIAAQLGINYMTVGRALAYHRLMLAAGMTDPYRELTDPSEAVARWRA
jgi:site-specific DNA recombinase